MWRRALIAGTTAAVVLAGTAFAVASPNADEPVESVAQAPADHWSEMQENLGDDWKVMVDQMERISGADWSTMVTMMQDLDMHGFDMQGSGMGSGMGSFDMQDSDMGSGMGGFDMDGFDMSGFDMGSGMGRPNVSR